MVVFIEETWGTIGLSLQHFVTMQFTNSWALSYGIKIDGVTVVYALELSIF